MAKKSQRTAPNPLADMPIQVFSWPTPNGHKVHILLEEMELPYSVNAIDIGAGDQFDPNFLALSPNNKIPAILDPNGPGGEPIALFESGAILLYLAGKTGEFLGETDADRFSTLQWLMFQMGGLGPMLGQAHHFRLYAPEKIEYGINRYTNEAKRLYGVIDRRLGEVEFLAGEDYTVADIAAWPWVRSHEGQGVSLDDFPNVKRWYETIGARPAVQRGIAVLAERSKPIQTDEERDVLFGNKQYDKR